MNIVEMVSDDAARVLNELRIDLSLPAIEVVNRAILLVGQMRGLALTTHGVLQPVVDPREENIW